MMGATVDHRILFAYSLALGHIVTVATVHGDCFEGVLHAMSPDDHVLVLKTVRTLRHHQGAKSQEPTSHNTLIIDLANVADILVRNTATLNDPIAKLTRKGFQTDTAISGASGARQRQLERWLPDAPEDPSLDLDDARSLRNWDQFKANEAKFGLSTNYSEDIYTTKLDRSRPDYAQRERDAERIAREIERSQAFASNKHLREERGQAVSDDDMDEEDRYGAVIREQQPSAAGSKVAWRPQPAKEGDANNASAAGGGGSQSLNLASGRYRSFSKSSGAAGLAGAASAVVPQPTPDQRQRTTSYMAPSSSTIATTTPSGKPNLDILGKRIQHGAIPAPTGHGPQKHPFLMTKSDGLIPKAVAVAQAKEYLTKVQKSGSLQVVPENEVLTEQARVKLMRDIKAQVAKMPDLIKRGPPVQVTLAPRAPAAAAPAVAQALPPTRLAAPTPHLIQRQAIGRAMGRGPMIPASMEEAKKLLRTQASISPRASGAAKSVVAAAPAPAAAAAASPSTAMGGVVGADQIVSVDKLNVVLQQEKDRVAQKQEMYRMQQQARLDKIAELKNSHARFNAVLVKLPRPKDLDDLLNTDRARERLGKQEQGAKQAQAVQGKRSRSKSPARSSPQVGAARPGTPSKGAAGAAAASPSVGTQSGARAASPSRKPGSAAASPSVGGMSEKDKKKFSLNLGAAAFVPTRPAASTAETRKVTTGFFAGKELKLAPFSLKTHMVPFTGSAPSNAQNNHSVLWTFANDNRSYKHDVHGDGVPMGMVPGPYYFFPTPVPTPASAPGGAPSMSGPNGSHQPQQQQQQNRNGPPNNASFNQGGGGGGSSGGQPQYIPAGPPGAVPPQAFAQVPPGAIPAYPGAIPGMPPGTTYVPIMPVPVPPPGSQPASAPNTQAGPNAGGPPQYFAAPTGFMPAGAGGPNQPMYAMVPQQQAHQHQHQQFQHQQQQQQQHHQHQQQQHQHPPQQGQNGPLPSGNAQGPPPGMPPMGMMMAGPPHGPPHMVPGGFAGMPPGMVPVPMHPGGPHPGPPPGSMGMMMPPPGPHGGPPPPHMMQFAMPGMQPHQMQMYPGPGPHMQQQQQQQQSPSE